MNRILSPNEHYCHSEGIAESGCFRTYRSNLIASHCRNRIWDMPKSIYSTHRHSDPEQRLRHNENNVVCLNQVVEVHRYHTVDI